MRKPFVVCAVFSALLVVVAGCGDDAKPTASAADNLDDRLFGIWTTQDEDLGEISFIFEEDGTLRRGVLGIEITGTWSTDGDKLTIMFPGGRYSYEITNGTLEFTTVARGVSDLSGFSFTTDVDATTLTGVTWVDEDGDELVFSADGTYRRGDDSFVFEEGTWTADGNTITTTVSPNSSPYSVSDDTITFTDDEGEEHVLTRKYRGTPTVSDPPSATTVAVASPDREILVALYNATDGPNWGSAYNWLTDAPLGSWYGVDVDTLGRGHSVTSPPQQPLGLAACGAHQPRQPDGPGSRQEQTDGSDPARARQPDEPDGPAARLQRPFGSDPARARQPDEPDGPVAQL